MAWSNSIATNLLTDPGYKGYVPHGNDVVDFKIIDPPDDRYIPGYSIVEADGDKKTVGPRLKDLNIPFSLYGLPIPITFGVRRLYGNIIWAIPLRESTRSSDTGGGSGGPTTSTTEYKYFATYAIGFGYPGNTDTGKRDIIRIWADGSLIYDRRGTGQTKIQGLNFNFHKGSEVQQPDPTIEASMGAGKAPTYRGMMYMVIKDLPVEMFGNRPPSISVEIGDTTVPAYTCTNIYPSSDKNGSRDQDTGFADWNRMLYYSINSTGNNTNSTVRTYDLANGTLLNTAYANVDDGVGWDNNSGFKTLADREHLRGVQSAVGGVGMTYIPWLNRVACMGTGGLGCIPILLFDPLSGITQTWVGYDNTSFGIDEWPGNIVSESDNYKLQYYQGGICYPTYMTPQIVYGQYASDTYIFTQSLYASAGITVLKLDGISGLFDIAYKESGVDYSQMTAGSIGYGYSDVMAVSGSNIYRYRVYNGAGRSGVGAASVIHGFKKTLWKNLGTNVNNVLYYAPEDTYVVFLTDGTVKKFDADGDETMSVDIGSGNLPSAAMSNTHLHDMSNGYFAWQMAPAGVTNEFDLNFGTLATYTETSSHYFVTNRQYSSKLRAFVGIGYTGGGDSGTGQTHSKAAACSIFYYDRLGDVRMPLADFIKGMALYSGYTTAEIYIDPEIDDMIDGAIISQITSYRSVINAISALYRIDVVESDGKVKFLRKPVGYDGTDFDVAAGETLVPSPDQPDAASFAFRREEEIAVPQVVQLRYLDKALSYNWSMQMASRSQTIETNGSDEQITYELPIAMTATEARTLAERALWTAWSSRTSYDFRLPPKYLKVEPGDVGSVVIGPYTYTVKAAEVTYNNDFSIGIRGTSFQSDEAVEFNADSGQGYEQVIPFELGGDLYVIETPLIQAGHNLSYASKYPIYMHLSPIIRTSSWTGATAYLSVAQQSFYRSASNTSPGCVCTVSGVPNVPDSLLQTDTLNTMSVIVSKGDPGLLVSCTEDDLLNGVNLAAYGNTGRWELIQFQTVDENEDGSFTLSNLVRARNGTDYAVDSHRPGDVLILMDPAYTDMDSMGENTINTTLQFKAVGPTQLPKTISSTTTRLKGYAALPWVPSSLRVTRSITAGTGDITIDWERRSRLVEGITDSSGDVQLPENDLDNYLVTVTRWPYYTWAFSGGSWHPTLVEGTTVTYTVTGATSLTLTAAQIRTAQLYEFSAPDNLTSSGSTFSQVPGSYIGSNADDNEIVAALGYDDFVAFKHLDIMVQQATTLSSGYGPGRMTRVTVEDT